MPSVNDAVEAFYARVVPGLRPTPPRPPAEAAAEAIDAVDRVVDALPGRVYFGLNDCRNDCETLSPRYTVSSQYRATVMLTSGMHANSHEPANF